MYDWLKALHIIAFVAWMAGMLYLPRLFVYHAAAQPGSELSETFKLMEQRLLRFIMTPAMITTFAFGIWLLLLNPELLRQPYMHAKLTLVFLMAGVHGWLSRLRRQFAADQNRHSQKFYRILNEVPTVLLIGIVILVVVRPGF
jgi:putative membrane protein